MNEMVKQHERCSREEATRMRLPCAGESGALLVVEQYKPTAARMGWTIEAQGNEVVVSGGTMQFDGTKQFFIYAQGDRIIYEKEI